MINFLDISNEKIKNNNITSRKRLVVKAIHVHETDHEFYHKL